MPLGSLCTGLFIVFWMVLLWGRAARSQTEQELFVQVFRPEKPQREQQIIVPLVVQDQDRGEIWIVVGADPAEARVQATSLIDKLRDLLRPEILTELAGKADREGTLSMGTLQGVGLEAAFDQRTLELRIVVPPDLRQTRGFDLRGRGAPPPAAGIVVPPSALSGFLNGRAGVDYVHRSETGEEEGRGPLRADLDGAVNVRTWVLEGLGSYVEDAEHPWQRGDVRLVHDYPERMVRTAAGDLSYPVTGFQSFRSLGGATVARNFSLQPYRVTQPLGRAEFFLNRPSRVEVFVNGRPVETLQLAPGRYNLRDFPFANGVNDVRLRITDDVGRVEEEFFPFFFDTRLLAAGENEYAYSLGFKSHTDDGIRNYDWSFPGFSLFHRFGVSDTLTLGGNLQGDGDQQMGGVELEWASFLGTVGSDVAVSRVEGSGWGAAGRVLYRYYDAATTRNPWGRAFTLGGEYRSSSFAALGTANPDNPVALDLLARYDQFLPYGMSMGLGGSYQVGRGSRRDTHSLSLFVRKVFACNASAALNVDRNRTEEGDNEWRTFLTVTWALADFRHIITATYDSQQKTERLNWEYLPKQPVGSVYLSAGADQTDQDRSLSGAVRYVGYHGETSFSHDVTQDRRGEGGREEWSSLRVGSALVFADSNVALSRPVADSFAMVVPRANLRGRTVGVDPVEGSYTARADALGPGVVPELQSYVQRSFTVDVPDLPLGYDMGPDLYTVVPGYKSGTVIRVGTDATVLLGGVLEGAGGAPISLEAGEVLSLDEPGRKPQLFFTNRKGKFRLEAMKPGRYEMRLYAHPESSITLTIPEGQAGFYDLGSVRLPPAVRPDGGRPEQPSSLE
jgi:outer membrane usher protein